MKRFLLLVSAMLAMTSLMAQDVYVTFCKNGKTCVYKNNTQLFISNQSGDNLTDGAVAVDPDTDDVYWIKINDAGSYYEYTIMKNNDTYMPAMDDNYIFDLGLGFNSYVYSVGEFNGRAVVWEGSYYNYHYLGSEDYYSQAYGVQVLPALQGDVIYTCGYILDADNQIEYGVVWKDFDPEPVIVVPNTRFYDVCYYDGRIFTIGEDGIYRDGDKIMDLPGYSFAFSDSKLGNIKIYGENIYFTYEYVDENFNFLSNVYKDGEVLYTNNLDPCESSFLDVYSGGVVYNSYDANGNIKIYKNGQVLYTISLNDWTAVKDICVVETCGNSNARTLPYFEGFEIGDTDWMCWTKIENYWNSSETYYPSYWQIGNEYVATGNYSAKHGYNGEYDQNDWLISPRISLANVTNAKLEFKTFEKYPSDMIYEGVLVSTSGTTQSSFTEIWTQSNASSEWKTVDVDLSAYQGQNIYLGFRYKGNNGHTWFIDDVSVTGTYDAVEETSFDNLAVYPNPANETICINGLDGETEVNIYNAIGALVKTVVVNTNDVIDLSNLPSGLYLARFGENTLKFTKE